MIRDAQIYFGMETPLRGRSGGHAGTAPTIPNTYRRSAKVKTRVLMLAELPQIAKQKIWRSQFNCKHSEKENNEKQDSCSEKD